MASKNAAFVHRLPVPVARALAVASSPPESSTSRKQANSNAFAHQLVNRVPVDLIQRQFCLGTGKASQFGGHRFLDLNCKLTGNFYVDVLVDPGVPVLTMVILRYGPVGDEYTSTGNQCPDLVLVDDRTCTGPGDGEPLDTFVIHAR